MKTKEDKNFESWYQYLCEVVKVYQETQSVKGISRRAAHYRVGAITKELFFAMGFDEIPVGEMPSREMAKEARQARLDIWHRTTPIEAPQEVEQQTLVVIDEQREEVVEVQEETQEYTKENTFFENVVSRLKSAVHNIFHRRKATGFFIKHLHDDDNGNDIFVWVNSKHKVDFILIINGNTVIECRAVAVDENYNENDYDKVHDFNKLFRAVFFIKVELDKHMRENEILRQKVNAIAEILCYEEKFEETT